MRFNIDPEALGALVTSEFKRWGIQFLVMLGAVPYFIGVGHILTFPLHFIDVPAQLAWTGYWVIFSILVSYYLISLKLHLIFDKKKIFSSSPLISIRPYLTIPLVVQTLGAWGDFLYIPKEVQATILQVFRPLEEASHILLFVSSVLLTWLLSEWVCRFKRWRSRRLLETSESDAN